MDASLGPVLAELSEASVLCKETGLLGKVVDPSHVAVVWKL